MDDNFRDRKYCLLLYPDDPTHVNAMEYLRSSGTNYAACLHDKDLHKETDEEKKPHWHVVIKSMNAMWNSAWQKKLGVKSNYIRVCQNLDGALRYLVHFDHPDKYQYDISEVEGPLKTRVAFLVADQDESTRVLSIVETISNSPGPVSYKEILLKVCKNGLYGDFRRLGNGVKYLIDEHNSEYEEQIQKTAGVVVSREHFNEYLKWTGSKGTDNLPPL